MATFAGQSVPTLTPDLLGTQRLMGRYSVAVDGTSTTTKSIGALRAGSLLNPTGIFGAVSVAFDGTTPLIDVYLVPKSTGTVDTNAILPTSVITEGTTGFYYSTAALVKTAGYVGKLTEDCEVVVVFTAGGSNTVGVIDIVIPFHHDLDPTTY